MEAVGSYEPLVDLAEGLRSGEIDLLRYLEQLEGRFQRLEPRLEAFLPEEGRFRRLAGRAEELLSQYPEGENRPPLFGVPVGVKDIFHVVGFETLAGSQPPADPLQGTPADAVTRLQEAGALILGKTVTTEFAYFAPGPTRNPHNLDHTPGGSSSGSAAAVAAGLSSLTLGTQTIGSVNRPAAFCGVVGFKPSYGRVSRVGLIPLAPSVDHVGFFTTDVASAELAAAHLCYDWRRAPGSKRPVLGVPEGPYLQSTEQVGDLHYRRVLRELEEAGFDLRPVPALEDFEGVRAAHQSIVAAESCQVHAQWFSEYEDRYHPTTLHLLEEGRKITEEELMRARDRRMRLRHRLSRTMEEQGLDLWVTPAAPGPAPEGLDSTGDPVMNLPWTHSGLPSLSLPAGQASNGLPLGIQLIGRWFADERLLGHALTVERALQDLQGTTIEDAMPGGKMVAG